MANKHPKCLCGCGAHTKGGTFRPGHDAKLHGKFTEGLKGTKEQREVARRNGWLKKGK